MSKLITRINLKSILTDFRVIIPEIQREYVWGDKVLGNNVLPYFMNDLAAQYGNYVAKKNEFENKVDVEFKQKVSTGVLSDTIADRELIRAKQKQQEDTESGRARNDMGFLYTYLPPFHENRTTSSFKPCYLIDGQQRFTTLMLLLIHTAVQEGRWNDFKSIFWQKADSGDFFRPAFDFKVRQITHDFFQVLIEQIKPETMDFNFQAIMDKTWFLEIYRHDTTVRSMIHTLCSWDNQYETLRKTYEKPDFYTFLSEHIFFWMFQVENTAQGEELYITMNGRGRNLTDMEVMKALIFQHCPPENAAELGRVWENIYDFFWRTKSKNLESADQGVNRFFHWLLILHVFSKTPRYEDLTVNIDASSFRLSQEMFNPNQGGITAKMIIEYGEALCRLQSIIDDFKLEIPEFSLKGIASEVDTKRFMRGSFLVLPLLYWIKRHEEKRTVEPRNVLRLCRFLRNASTVRNVSREFTRNLWGAFSLVDFLAERDFDLINLDQTKVSDTIFPAEEQFKIKLYQEWPDQRNELEALIWEIEDYKCKLIASVEDSYSIEVFLKNIACFRTEATEPPDIKRTQQKFEHFKMWFTYLDNIPDAAWQWLLLPKHRGYRRIRNLISPLSKCRMMEQKELVESMIAFVEQDGDPEQNFVAEEREFIGDYWNQRQEIEDVFLQLAIAISLCRRHSNESSARAIDEDYNQFGIWDTPPQELFPGKMLRTYCSEQFPYCFRSVHRTNTRWFPSSGTYILSCHTANFDEEQLIDEWLQP